MMRAILFLAGLGLVATAAVGQDAPPTGSGPRGTSGEVHDDAVGYATLLTVGAGATPTVRVAAMHPTLPAASFVEVTALDSGRTIVAMVVGPYRGSGVVGLSPDAAQALGVGEGAPVRVRAVLPNPQDQAALRTGQPAGTRLDAPPALLVALRRKLPGRSSAHLPAPATRTFPGRAVAPVARIPVDVVAPRVAPATRPAPAAPISLARGGYGVQVAALSSPDRAAALARILGGHVIAAGRLYRVQLGPFADAAAATRAREGAARQGYRDAHVFQSQ